MFVATYHAAGENQCEPTDPDAIRTMFAVFGYVELLCFMRFALVAKLL